MVRRTDYYPFGAVAKVWDSPEQTQQEAYRFGYQGDYSEKDEETGWNHFELRQYDPIIGRWMSVDPARQFASPYVGMGNNPINGVDPTGGICPTCPNSPHNESITMLDEVVVTAKRGIQGIGDWFNDLSYPSWNFQGVQTVWTGSGANFQEFAGKFDPSKITLSIDFDMVQDLLNFWGKRSPSDQHNRNNQAPSRESMAKTSVSRASENDSPVLDNVEKQHSSVHAAGYNWYDEGVKLIDGADAAGSSILNVNDSLRETRYWNDGVLIGKDTFRIK